MGLSESATLAGVEEIPDLREVTSHSSEPTQQDQAPSKPDKETPPLPESDILTQFSNFVEGTQHTELNIHQSGGCKC